MDGKTSRAAGEVFRWILVLCILTVTRTFGEERIVLGPAESGTWSGSEKWLTGAYGAAATYYDFEDPAHGPCAFVLSNTVAGPENAADWRCLPFSLGPAAGGARLVSLSFAYKLSDRVAPGDNMRVELRFFDSTGTNRVGQRSVQVGARTGDSAMSSYRTLTMNGILPPRKARMADVSINMDSWVSGTGRFDDFSITTEPRSLLFKAGAGAVVLLGVGILVLLLNRIWRRRTGNDLTLATRRP
jgi:hypothetical protein